MPEPIRCCANNLQAFRYGAALQALADAGGDVKLERCLSFCIGGKLVYAADEAEFERLLRGEDMKDGRAEAPNTSTTE
ncbi:hypothetical protein [Paenibacillus glycinis]|uniref:DUF1450 domain-containing protein n=1 Tax=Paenibacillus glycinis TaxID=2697035 RepID=A0ABW9XPW1_9BACL|nr:hypothetical protein [Paenibacillus glycinis]NBD24675.1 hypothetical protein [Paenibacillus glycinis]